MTDLVSVQLSSAAKKYAFRAALAVFIFQFGRSLVDSSPGSPYHGMAMGDRIVWGFLMSLLMSVVGAIVGGAIGLAVDFRGTKSTVVPSPQVPATPPRVEAASVPAAPTSFPGSSHPAAPRQVNIPVAEVGDDAPEHLWAAALAELDGPNRRNGLWAKCYAQASGVEPVAKAAYLAQRAQELLAEAQAVASAQAAELAATAAHAARLDAVAVEQRSMYEDLEHLKLNGSAAMAALHRLILGIGGSAEWKVPSLFRIPVWCVTIAGESHTFPTNDALCIWGVEALPPLVQAVLPPVLQEAVGVYRPLGECPRCHVKVFMSAPQCLTCLASFDEHSSWKPLKL